MWGGGGAPPPTPPRGNPIVSYAPGGIVDWNPDMSQSIDVSESQSEGLHVGLSPRQSREDYRAMIQDAIRVLVDEYGVDYLITKLNGLTEQLENGEEFDFVDVFEEEMHNWLDSRYGRSQRRSSYPPSMHALARREAS